jgi:hypothetical protein
MAEELKKCPEFAERNCIQEMWEARGHSMKLLPKFHPELNPIERCWSWIRWWINQRNDRTVATLDKNLLASWTAMDPKQIPRYWRKSRDYSEAYRLKLKTEAVEKLLKQKKRHRGVDDEEAFDF